MDSHSRFPIHEAFLASAVKTLQEDRRIVGLAAAGSWAEGRIDAFSDLDLVVAVEPDDFESVLEARQDIAARLGRLAAAFTGEHVGEPRLLICLYDDPVLHVDLKFVAVDRIGPVVGDAVPLWARDSRFEPALNAVAGQKVPPSEAQWIEDRFWIWVHYATTKIARGELFEALDFLGFLRVHALVPVLRGRLGIEGIGVRRLEQQAPAEAAQLAATVATHDAASCLDALTASIRLYREWRSPEVKRGEDAERVAMGYLKSAA